MAEKDEFEEEIEKELDKELKGESKEKIKKETEEKKDIKITEQKSISESEKKLAEIQAEKMRLKAVMEEKQGKIKKKAPQKSEKSQVSLVKKLKSKKEKTEVSSEISKKEKIQAQLARLFTWENIKTTFKMIFSVENLIKYKRLILLIILVINPEIVFISSSTIKLNQLIKEQSPQQTQFNYRYGEELFTINIYNPMAWDDNSTQFREFSYIIKYTQDPNSTYLLPLDQYYIIIHNLTIVISFKDKNNPNSNWYSAFVNIYQINKTLKFGDYISNTISIPKGIFAENLPNSTYWNVYMIQITLNATQIYNPNEYEFITGSFQGPIVKILELRPLNLKTANNYGGMVTIGYMFCGILFLTFFGIWLRKKRYSYIKPY